MQKDLYFQKLRGVAIIAVVLIHATSQSFANEYSYNISVGLILRQFINYAVPLFLFISGYFAYKSNNKKIITKLLRILIPYLVWSFIAIVIYQRTQFNIKHIMKLLLTGQALGIYYYIIVLVQLIVLTPLIIKIANTDKCNYYYLITPIIIGIIYIIKIFGNDIVFTNYTSICFTWFIFYYHGIMVSKNGNYIHGNFKLYFIFLILSIIEGFIWKNNGSIDLAISQTKITTIATSLIFINLLIKNKEFINNKLRGTLLSNIGENSFGIYLSHLFILNSIQGRLNSIYILYKIQLFNIIITAIVTIIICKIGCYIFKKIFGEKISKNIMGLE